MYLTKHDGISPGRGRGLQRSDSGDLGPWEAKTNGIAAIRVPRIAITTTNELVARSDIFGLQSSAAPFGEWATVPGSVSEDFDAIALQTHTVAPVKLLEVGIEHDYDVSYASVYYRYSATSQWTSLLLDYEYYTAMAAQRHTSSDRMYIWTPGELHRNGTLWFQFEEIPAPFFPTSGVIHPTNDDVLFVSKSGTDPIQMSTDRGSTWVSISQGLPAGTAVRVLVDPADANHLAAIYSNRSPWESFDQGATWVERIAAFGSALVVAADWSPRTSNIFLATNNNGVHSTKWGDLTDGLPSNRLSDVLYSEGRRELFVSGSGGIHSRKIAPVVPEAISAALVEPEGAAFAVGEPSGSAMLPPEFAIHPNPFEDQVEIVTSEKFGADVVFSVFDATGRRIRTSESRGAATRSHRWVWNGRDEEGRAVAPGVYFLRMESGSLQRMRGSSACAERLLTCARAAVPCARPSDRISRTSPRAERTCRKNRRLPPRQPRRRRLPRSAARWGRSPTWSVTSPRSGGATCSIPSI